MARLVRRGPLAPISASRVNLTAMANEIFAIEVHLLQHLSAARRAFCRYGVSLSLNPDSQEHEKNEQGDSESNKDVNTEKDRREYDHWRANCGNSQTKCLYISACTNPNGTRLSGVVVDFRPRKLVRFS